MPGRRSVFAWALALCLAFASPTAALAPAAEAGTQVSSYVNSTVTITTNFGVIVGMLYDQGAPITTSNFINLSTSSFYDGSKFHRIVDDFVIQTGDPNSKDNNPYNDGMGGSGTTIPLEINENLTHEDGAFGMARSNDPNSASSQFYICDGPQHQLDGNYAVFGITVEGIDVVRTIASQPTWGYKRPLLKDHPIGDIVMTSVVVSLGYWNNSTVPEKGGGLFGPGGVFGGSGGGALLVLLAAGAAVSMGYLFVPPVRVRVQAAARRLPPASRFVAPLRRLVPRRSAR